MKRACMNLRKNVLVILECSLHQPKTKIDNY